MYSANCTGKERGTGQPGFYACENNYLEAILVSPASPENAIKECLFSSLVLSSEALRIVAPLTAALEAAMMVKSLPVMPRRTSLIESCQSSLPSR